MGVWYHQDNDGHLLILVEVIEGGMECECCVPEAVPADKTNDFNEYITDPLSIHNPSVID